MRKAFAEALGTFAMVFAGTGAIVVNDVAGGVVTHVGVALAFGLVVMAMIHFLGDVSGAHLNPAVTLGLLAAGRFSAASGPGYLAAQIVGASAASGLLKLFFAGHKTLGATLPAGPAWQSFVLEIVLAFVLMLTILCVAAAGPAARGMAGIAIGGVVGLEAFFAGPISGASMNPARSLAPALLSWRWEHLWIYLTAPFLGAWLAVPAAAWLYPPAEKETP
jgi:aquaporin NIP